MADERVSFDQRSAEDFLFASFMGARPLLVGPDERTRRPELTRDLLGELGSPERGLTCLLVAGSKGKGSTCAFAARLLGLSGRPVGLFSSPHLLDVRERIRVNGRAIPIERFVTLVERVAEPAGRRAATLPAEAYLSPTGLLLAVALLHFRASGVELAVIEAGRGARFDDTRLVEHPVAALTPIMLEHPHELGPGLARIAWHKAGAIEPGGVAFTARQHPRAMVELWDEAARQGARVARVARVGGEVRLRRQRDGTVEVRTERRRYAGLRPGLRGPHQAENLALALAASEALWPGLAEQPLEAVQAAVAGVRWPGRCEVLRREPLVLVDGAINAAAGRAFLAGALPLSGPPIVAIAGAPADKDYEGLFRVLAPHVARLYVTRAANPYLRFPDDAAEVARRYVESVAEAPNVAEAITAALAELPAEGTLWIVGTQSLVADALRVWGRDLEEI
jgi:dihydrofolate synthase / folylpolyglutamate synthase